MRILIILTILALTACASQVSDATEGSYTPKIGDIYFQSLPSSPLVTTIEGATHSPYSHCGILNMSSDGWVIHEAIGPVRVTQLADWIAQGEDGAYDVYRLKESYQPKVEDFIEATFPYMGRPYDIEYDFDDEKIYCSELIFKAFRSVFDEDLGEVVTLGDLDWEPYEDFIISIDASLPLERKMITPKHLSEAKQLDPVLKTIK